MLNKGDTCYVRHDGKIKDAKYIEPSSIPKAHRVEVKGIKIEYLIASDFEPDSDFCRFVCMTGIKGKDKCTG